MKQIAAGFEARAILIIASLDQKQVFRGQTMTLMGIVAKAAREC